MSHRSRGWLFAILFLALATAEWLRHPSLLGVAAVGLAVLAALWVLWPLAERTHRLTLLSIIVLAIAVTIQSYRLNAIDNDWPKIRESLVTRAFQALEGELRQAQDETEDLVGAAQIAAANDRVTAFDQLERAVARAGSEIGVAVLDSSDIPYAWAGRFRIAPRARGEFLQVQSNPFYVVLETRRDLEGGRTAVASVLLWSDPSAPDRSGSLAERFRRKTKVGLVIYPATGAPVGDSVFVYEQPTTAGTRQLFIARPLPPEQGGSKESALAQSGFMISGILLLVLALAILVERRVVGRLLMVAALLWIFLRAPAGEYLGLTYWFSSATFYRSLLGPISSTAGALAIASILVMVGAIALWRQRLPARWYTALVGAALLLVAPYAMRELGRGITTPANGVPLGLWLAWQITLLLATAAPIVLAAALFRGQRIIDRTPPTIWLGVALAVVATIAGVYVWGPRIGWPPWYTFLGRRRSFWSPDQLPAVGQLPGSR